MGQKTTENFDKRFGDRITVAYRQKHWEPEEAQIHNSKLLKAYTQVLVGLLNREATQEELLGIVNIAVCKQRRKNKITEHSVTSK
jgi:hypothetical protein